MNKEFIQLLCCPTCKGELKEKEKVTPEKKKAALQCIMCKQVFPVIDNIPYLLQPSLKEEYADIKQTYEQKDVAEKFGLDGKYTGSVRYRNLLREKVAFIVAEKLLSHGIILDAGCGNGLLLKKLVAKRPDARIIGLDISLSMIKQAKERLGEQVDFVIGSVNALPVKSGVVDATLCIDVLHHFSEQMVIIPMREVFRVTKDSGFSVVYLIISTFFDGCLSFGYKTLQFFKLKPRIEETPLAGLHAHKVSRSFIDECMQQQQAQWKLFWVTPFLNWAFLVVWRKK